MRYEVTQDLETGNYLIDSEHRQLFAAVNALMDACAQGHGRDQITKTIQFLNDYVRKHFSDEENLQLQHHYPGYPAHKTFHEGYCRQLEAKTAMIVQEGPTVRTLGEINQIVGVLVGHIRTEDKRLAQYILEQGH